MNIEGDKMIKSSEEVRHPIEQGIVHIPIARFSNSEQLKKEFPLVVDIDFKAYQRLKEKAQETIDKSMSKTIVPVKGNIQKVIHDEELDSHWKLGLIGGFTTVASVSIAICLLNFIKLPNEEMKLVQEQFNYSDSLKQSILISSKQLERKYDQALENLGILTQDNFENREENKNSSRR